MEFRDKVISPPFTLIYYTHFLVPRWVGKGHLPANDIRTGKYRYGQDPEKLNSMGKKGLNKCSI